MKQALQIAIDYMNDRLEDHDCKYQRHPATEAERINILADIETVKEALAKQKHFDLNEDLKAWQKDGSPIPAKQEQGEPVGETYLCDKCSTPFDGDWECPSCGHNTSTKEPVYTTPQQRSWVGLTDEQMRKICGSVPSIREAVKEAEAILKGNNTIIQTYPEKDKT